MSDPTSITIGNGMKEAYGNGISTMVAITNGTGSSATLIKSHNWDGKVWKFPYAPSIASGERAACLHVQSSESEQASTGAVVYRVKDANGAEFDTFVGWSTPGDGTNKVYVECRAVDHWWSIGTLDIMIGLIGSSGTISTDLGRNGFNVVGSIGQSASPVLSFFIGPE